MAAVAVESRNAMTKTKAEAEAPSHWPCLCRNKAPEVRSQNKERVQHGIWRRQETTETSWRLTREGLRKRTQVSSLVDCKLEATKYVI